MCGVVKCNVSTGVVIQAQEDAAAAVAKDKFYRQALEELTLFKSRMAAALLQAQEQLQSANIQADEMESTYQSAWTASQANQSKSTALLEELSEASLFNFAKLSCMKISASIRTPM